MSNPKREDGSPMKDGINNNTYNLLFGDYASLPEEEQGSYENVVAYATIDRFTKLQEKKIFTKLLKLLYKNTIIDLEKITFNEETKQYEYKNNDKVGQLFSSFLDVIVVFTMYLVAYTLKYGLSLQRRLDD